MINNKFILVFYFTLFSLIASGNEKNTDAILQLDNLVNSMRNKSLSEIEYQEMLKKAEKYSEQLDKQNANPFKPYGGLIKFPPSTIIELGPALSAFNNYHLLYVNSSVKRTEGFVGLAMLQDERGIPATLSMILNHSNSTVLRSSYIEMLALYGKKAEKAIPFLDYLYNNEWNPDVEKTILKVKKIILSDQAKKPWGRYKIYKELRIARKQFCGELVDIKYIEYPQPEDSKTNQIKSISKEEQEFLTSKGLSNDSYDMLWKNKGLTRYITFKTLRKEKLFLIDKYSETHEVKGGRRRTVEDLFAVGDRIFLITMSSHNSNRERYIEEIIWDKNSDSFKFDEPRFYMGANYKTITDEKNHYKLDGYNWSYLINKETGVIESGNICGESVTINYAL